MKQWFINLWQKVSNAFKTVKWLKWVAVGVAGVIVASTVLVVALSGGKDNGKDSSSSSNSTPTESSSPAPGSSDSSSDSPDSSSSEPAQTPSEYDEYLKFELSEDQTYYVISELIKYEEEHFILPATYRGKPVKEIKAGAFRYNNDALTEITIPDSITRIGQMAFHNCANLATIHVSDNITYLGNNAFLGTAFYNDTANWVDGFLYLGSYLLKANDVKGHIEVKAGTTYIEARAFAGCTELLGVTFPASLRVIEKEAFDGCTKFFNVHFENSTGWKVSNDTAFDFENAIAIEDDLNIANAGVELLKTTYLRYEWRYGV